MPKRRAPEQYAAAVAAGDAPNASDFADADVWAQEQEAWVAKQPTGVDEELPPRGDPQRRKAWQRITKQHAALMRTARAAAAPVLAAASTTLAVPTPRAEPQPQSKAERFKSTLEMLDRGGPDAEKMRTKFRSTQGFCDQRLAAWLPGCGAWHHCSVPCEEAHRFPFHANAAAFLDRMGGKVYINGRAAPGQGALTADAFVARAKQRDAYGRHAIDLHGLTVQLCHARSPLRGASIAALQFSIMSADTAIFAH